MEMTEAAANSTCTLKQTVCPGNTLGMLSREILCVVWHNCRLLMGNLQIDVPLSGCISRESRSPLKLNRSYLKSLLTNSNPLGRDVRGRGKSIHGVAMDFKVQGGALLPGQE